MSGQEAQFISIDGTDWEFIPPKGFSNKKIGPGDEIISSIIFSNPKYNCAMAFHIVKTEKPKELLDFETHFISNSESIGGKILKKISIANDIKCTDLFLITNKYSPIDINYEYNWIIQNDHYHIIVICSVPNLELAPMLETVLIESFSSVRYQK